MGKHSEWRKEAKKAQRKRRRQASAVIKCEQETQENLRREQSPSYKLWLEEQNQLEDFQFAEELRTLKEREALFQLREKENQEKWELLQLKLRKAQEVRLLQNIKIKEEWEAEQARLKALKEQKEKLEEEKYLSEKRLQEQIDAFLNDNAEMPEELNALMETNPGKTICPFFSRTGACRFGDICSRNHQRPTISAVLLIRNFYSHYSLDAKENEHGDLSLEFENKEIYAHFKEFFHDVIPEFELFGELHQFKVCCNKEPHLRGNVYVEYTSPREAMKSYRKFQGRFYGGRQLNVEFCKISSWKSAICGLFHRRCCPKGSVCNFLHVLRNPGNAFMKYLDSHPDNNGKTTIKYRPKDDWNESERRNWRWSSSPEIDTSRRSLERLKEVEHVKKYNRNSTKTERSSRRSWSKSSPKPSSSKSDKTLNEVKRHPRRRSRSRRKRERCKDRTHRKSSKRR